MAVVYLAHDLKHGRKVALKVLAPEISALVGAARFRQEIEFAARLQHPHILAVHDSGEAAGSLWFTMPYVEGESTRISRIRLAPPRHCAQASTSLRTTRSSFPPRPFFSSTLPGRARG
jgi:serine/threonine protein kinase